MLRSACHRTAAIGTSLVLCIPMAVYSDQSLPFVKFPIYLIPPWHTSLYLPPSVLPSLQSQSHFNSSVLSQFVMSCFFMLLVLTAIGLPCDDKSLHAVITVSFEDCICKHESAFLHHAVGEVPHFCSCNQKYSV